MNEMTAPQAQGGLGHNSGSVPGPDAIHEFLKEDAAPILTRADELLAAMVKVPATIEDDDTSAKATEFVRQIAACSSRADTARTEAKKPYLDGGKAVDAFFKPVTGKLDDAKRDVNRRIGAYLQEKERKAREEAAAREKAAREAEAQARREAEEAAKAAETDEERQEAERMAREAELAAEATRNATVATETASAGTSRGDYGGTSSLRKVWKGEITDLQAIELEKLRPYFAPADLEKAIRGYIKAGGRQLAGVRIFEEASAVTR